MRRSDLASVAIAVLLAPSGALSQGAAAGDADGKVDSLEKLQGMQSTGNVAAAEIPQTGKRADAIHKPLANIKLPPEFKIDLYPIVPAKDRLDRYAKTGENSGFR